MRVAAAFRTHPMSWTDGGEVVTVISLTGAMKVYDRVKRPMKYIETILNENEGGIDKILLGGREVYPVMSLPAVINGARPLDR